MNRQITSLDIYQDIPSDVYTSEGFFIMEKFLEHFKNYPFIFVVGGRGTGKTYSTLKFLHDKRHVFIRRTDEEIKILCQMDGGDKEMSESPWRQLNSDFGWNIKAKNVARGKYGFFDFGESWKEENDGKFLANILALSQCGKVKGAGYENVEYIFYDEFIPLEGTRNTKNDGYYLQQLYETISRNRESKNLSPTKLICCANASTISNSIFLEFGIVNDCARLIESGKEILLLKERGIVVAFLKNNAAFINKKKETALYKAIPKTSKMYSSSIENDFYVDDFHDVGKVDLRGYKVICMIEDRNGIYCVYRKNNKYYIGRNISGKLNEKTLRFNINFDNAYKKCGAFLFSETWFHYLENNLNFEDFEIKYLYFNLVNKKIGR